MFRNRHPKHSNPTASDWPSLTSYGSLVFVGIDVSARELAVALQVGDLLIMKNSSPQVTNSARSQSGEDWSLVKSWPSPMEEWKLYSAGRSGKVMSRVHCLLPKRTTSCPLSLYTWAGLPTWPCSFAHSSAACEFSKSPIRYVWPSLRAKPITRNLPAGALGCMSWVLIF